MPVPFVQLLAWFCFIALFATFVTLVALLIQALIVLFNLPPENDDARD